jgi:ubiquitin carboxyl-terminal hydrolase 8
MIQGLQNMGNTCSINTMIQCLGHCDAFRKFLLEETQLFRKKENYRFSMGDELRMICKQLWVDKDSLIPSRFLSALQETLGKDFRIGREQMDITEVWMILIQNLLEESHQVEFQSIYLQACSYSHPMLDYLHKEMVTQWTKHSQMTNSPLLDLIQGVQVQQMECKTCGKLYHNIEPFQCTYFELPEKENVALEECLVKWLEKDKVEDWKCDQCKGSTNEKVLRVWRLPKIWMIVLKRFHGLKKLHTPVHIPQELRLPVGFEMAEPSACSYQLKAIGNHYGSLYGGHYNAICKNDLGDHPWCLYDDLSIMGIKDISSILQNNRDAYVLFFERC